MPGLYVARKFIASKGKVERTDEFMARTEISFGAKNDGTGTGGYFVRVEGERHSAVYGGFETHRRAEQVAATLRGQSYWDTGEGPEGI